MLFALLFVIELVVLFLLSQLLSKLLYLFFYSVTRSEKATIYWMAILFFPGVLVHELAHALAASLLFVPVGNIEFFPKVLDDRIKLGSVQVGKTDFVRSFFIGVAPVIIGSFVLFSVFFLYFSQTFVLPSIIKIFISVYLLFEVSNTMFSSKKDLEGTSVFLVFVVALLVVFYFIFRPSFMTISAFFLPWEPYLQKAILVMAVPLGIDLLLCLLARILVKKRLLTSI